MKTAKAVRRNPGQSDGISIANFITVYSKASNVCQILPLVNRFTARASVAHPGESAPEAFLRFRQHVLATPWLFERLCAEKEREAFAARMVELGREQGCFFTANEVINGLNDARREWLERGILG